MTQLHIARNGQQLGVFAEQEIQSGLTSGQFFPNDLYWTEGMTDWQSLNSRFSMTVPVAPVMTAGTPPAFNPYAAPQSNVVSPAMMPRYTLASRGGRLGAAILDGLVGLLVVGLPLVCGIAIMDPKSKSPDQAVSLAAIICFVLAGLGLIGLTIYNIVLLTTRGQTIAKKWLGIRIVTHPDGQNPGFVKAFLLRSFVNGIINQLVPFYALVDICFIFREDQRCLHDLIADTVVIEDKTTQV